MISKIRTCLVAILAAATVVTSVPVYAADTKVDTNIETVENQPSDSEQIEENQVQNAIEQHLNYLYIESPYVETPATQRIVVSWGDGTENIEEIDLSVEHNGDTQTWTSVKSEDGVFLYEKAYADGEDGIYTITKLTVKTAEMETSYLLSDLGMEAKFGVNETYEGMSELQPIEGQPDAEAATDEEQYDVAVMSIDEDGNVMEESSIEDALEKAEVEEYDSDEDIQTYAEDNARAVDDSRAVNENVVVALDPGHDSTHTGAGANGVREEVLTLKIAQYCKEELEKYANVSVYMTRTTAACPYPSNKNSGGDISDRVYAAAKAGASIFVSFHLNSSTSTSAKGAEVIVPNDSWKPEVAQQGKELANDIMDELTAIGLQKRSIYSKDTTLADEKYPDGSKSDYFSVQIAAKENNIPGIIVEHAFVTNTGDVNTYLNNEAGLKKLGVADATGIAKYLGVSKEKGTWVEDSNGWKYKEGGKYVTNSWKDIDGKRYYFDANGYRVTGWQTIGGKKYFFMPEGYMMTGWISFGSTRYYLDKNGVMQTGWQTIDGKRYFFMPEGYMMRGWISFGKTRYYLDSNGVMVTGKQVIDGTTYTFASDGKLIVESKRGWKTVNGKKYYYNENGVAVTGWQTIDGKKYFFMPEGYMMTGWISFGSTRYYLMPDGHMLTGWCSFGSTKYYLASDGKMVRGWQTISGKKYYFNTDGIMQTGWQTIDGKKYFFMPEGYMMTGWISFGKTRYYLDKNGVMQTGWQFISNTWYYFRTNGTLDDSCTTDQLMAISGKTTVTASQMEKYFKAKGATYPAYYAETDAPTLEKFCQIYVEEANAEGINGAIAFTQAMKETAWLKFGGDVKIEQNNFAGLGTTGGGVAGASFTTVREGIRAQIQHLKAYGSKDALKNECVDPRFSLVTRGSAPYVEWLGQKENPNGYGLPIFSFRISIPSSSILAASSTTGPRTSYSTLSSFDDFPNVLIKTTPLLIFTII